MSAMMLLPPSENKCQECAVEHEQEWPHDKNSFFYQFLFFNLNGRTATWEDAMAHCNEEMKQMWREELRAKGIDPNS